MFFSGISDEAGQPIESQIRAHTDLGWDYMELRMVSGTNITDPDLGRHLARSYATVEGNRVHQVLEVVRNLLTALEPIRERKMLLYFSAGLPEHPGAQYLHLAELDDEIIKGTRTTLFQMERLFREANSGRVSIFPVDVTGMDPDFGTFQDFSKKKDGLVSLALNTGGKAILNTNDLGGALQGAVTASRHYYLLGFTPPSGARPIHCTIL